MRPTPPEFSGAEGAGLAEAEGLTERIEVHLGTFSKALGSFGAYVAGSSPLIELLHNRARSFIYSTALPPAVLGAMQAGLAIVRQEPCRRAYLLEQASQFRGRLQEAGFDTLDSETQIIPVWVGDNHQALEFAARLRQAGLMAVAIRPPTVPPGGARLRLSLSAAQGAVDLAKAAKSVIRVGREMGLEKRPGRSAAVSIRRLAK